MENIYQPEKSQRVVTFLNREEVDFLDKFGKDALFTTGTKVSRAKLISWLVDFLKKLKFAGDGIKSENDFQEKIQMVFKNRFLLKNPTCHGRAF